MERIAYEIGFREALNLFDFGVDVLSEDEQEAQIQARLEVDLTK